MILGSTAADIVPLSPRGIFFLEEIQINWTGSVPGGNREHLGHPPRLLVISSYRRYRISFFGISFIIPLVKIIKYSAIDRTNFL
jgi:hypothetical protein